MDSGLPYRPPFGLLSPQSDRLGIRNQAVSQFADADADACPRDPGANLLTQKSVKFNGSNLRRIERMEKRVERRSSSQLNGAQFMPAALSSKSYKGVGARSRKPGATKQTFEEVHRSTDLTPSSNIPQWHRSHFRQASKELQEFALKEYRTKHLLDDSRHSALILDQFPKHREEIIQRNLLREQKVQKKKQIMDQVQMQEERYMYERRKEWQMMQIRKRAARGSMEGSKSATGQMSPDASSAFPLQGNCSRLCKQLNEFIESNPASRNSPQIVGSNKGSYDSVVDRSKDVTMPPNTTPALQNFEIHGTSKKRYDSIHDTIQLFNLMKEERDAVLQGKSPAGNERRQMYRSPSLLGYNKDLDDPHNSRLHLDIENKRQQEQLRQAKQDAFNTGQRQQSSKHLEQVASSQQFTFANGQIKDSEKRKRDSQVSSLPRIKDNRQQKQSVDQSSQLAGDNVEGMASPTSQELESDLLEDNESFNFVSTRNQRHDENRKLLQRLKQKHLKYNLNLTANSKYYQRAHKKNASVQIYRDRIWEMYHDGYQKSTLLQPELDRCQMAEAGEESEGKGASQPQTKRKSSRNQQEDSGHGQKLFIKKPFKLNQALHSQSYKQQKEFDQVLTDSILIENKLVEKSIDKMAQELGKSKQLDQDQKQAKSQFQKFLLRPGTESGGTNDIEDTVANSQSKGVSSVEHKHLGIWKLMDKTNIFIDTAEPSYDENVNVDISQSEQGSTQHQQQPEAPESPMDSIIQGLDQTSMKQDKTQQKLPNYTRMQMENTSPQKKEKQLEIMKKEQHVDRQSPIRNLFNKIQDHDKNIQELSIIESIKRGLQNTDKLNLEIEQIKNLRMAALNQSVNENLSAEEKYSSKLLVRDLNLLSQKMGSPPQTQSVVVANDKKKKDEKHEDGTSDSNSEFTDVNRYFLRQTSISKLNRLQLSQKKKKEHAVAKPGQKSKPIEQYEDKDYLPLGMDLRQLSLSCKAVASTENKLKSPIQKQQFIAEAQLRAVKLNQQEKRLKALSNMIKQNRQPDPIMYQSMFRSQQKPMQESQDLMSPNMRAKRHANEEQTSLFGDSSYLSGSRAKSQFRDNHRSSIRKAEIIVKSSSPNRSKSITTVDQEQQDQLQRNDQRMGSNAEAAILRTTESPPAASHLSSRLGFEASDPRLAACNEKDLEAYQKMNIKTGQSGINKSILDPDVGEEERQMLYQLFKKEQIGRLRQFVKQSKKRHRIQNPWEYDSDDSQVSLQSEGKPWRLYGRLPRNKQTGEAYRIPSLQQIKQILLDREKTTREIVDALFPPHVDFRDLLCALAIMHHSKLISAEMLRNIRKREDKLAEYVNLITGENIYQNGQLLPVEKLQKKQLTRHLSRSFSEYVSFNSEQNAKKVAHSLISKLKYFEKCKQSFNPKTRQELDDDPEFRFFMTCHDDMGLALPILEKVFHRTLCLYDYTLSAAQSRALKFAARFFDDFINRLLMDNCGMTDRQFADILSSLNKLSDFKAIIYRNQEFGMKAVHQIKQLTARGIPNHLDELVIYNCKIKSLTAERLLANLNDHSYLSKLSLVNANLSHRCVLLLLTLITNNKYIYSLDLSWNHLKSKSYEALLQFLRKNRTLRSVNLAWNNLIDGPTAAAQSKRKREMLEKRPLSARSGSPSGGPTTQGGFMLSHATSFNKNKVEDQEWQLEIGEHELLVTDCLTRFIKYNSNLLHMDIQGTGLTEYCLKMVGKALRKSRSIIGIHLSENPGLNETSKSYIFDRVKCKDSLFAVPRPMDLHILEERVKNTNAQANHRMFQDSVKLREINERKRAQKQKPIVSMQRDDRLCVMTRYNGHKGEMPRCPGQWQMLSGQHEDCWICDKWIFSLVFFNPARLESQSLWDNCDDMKRHLIKQLQKIHKDVESNEMELGERDRPLYESAYPGIENPNMDESESVHVYASFTNWEPMRMIPFLNYIESLDYDKPNFLEKLQKEGKISTRYKTYEDLHEEDLEVFARELLDYRKKIREGHWERLLQKSLKYRRPAILNLDAKELERPERLYILPIYIKSGKQHMLVKAQDKELGTCDWFYQREISDFRIEDINLFKKPLGSFLIQRKFMKEFSVFAEWQEDDPNILQKVKEDAASHWKLAKIKIDAEDWSNLMNVLDENMPLLKHIYIWLQSSSDSYPGISGLDFSRFMHNMKMVDNKLPSSRIDQLFLRSIMFLDPLAVKPIVMYRWSFFESLIRLSKDKYIDTNQESTYAGALNRLIHKKFVPNLDKVDFEPWQEMREDYIWTLEMDDLLRANVEGLREVFNYFAVKRKLAYEECLNIFMQYLTSPLTSSQAKLAYGMSKMTVIEEMKLLDPKGYMFMEFVEFLEMICRVAYIKFKGSDLDSKELPEQVEYILDQLLAIVGLEKQKPHVESLEVSESDEDY